MRQFNLMILAPMN